MPSAPTSTPAQTSGRYADKGFQSASRGGNGAQEPDLPRERTGSVNWRETATPTQWLARGARGERRDAAAEILPAANPLRSEAARGLRQGGLGTRWHG